MLIMIFSNHTMIARTDDNDIELKQLIVVMS